MPLYLAASFLLAAVLAASAFVGRVEYRAAAVRLLAPIGVLVGAALAFGGGGAGWRTLGAERDLMVLAGVGVGAGWLLVMALDRVEGHAATAACFGVAACALPLVVAGEWLGPTLMFVAVIALAGGLAAHIGRSGALLLQVGAGLGAVAAGLILARAGEWARPSSLDGLEAALLIAGVVILLWPFDRSGGWRVAGRPTAAFLSLLHVLAFALLASADLAPQPWVASGVLAVTLASALWHGIRSPESFVPGPLAVGAALAAGLLSPGLAVPAGIAAVSASIVGALGAPYGSSAGLVGGVVPLGAGWLVLLTAVTRAFEPAGGSAELTVRLPWLVFVSLAPLIMAAGVIGTVGWLRRARSSGRLRAVAAEGALLFSLAAVIFSKTLLRLEASPLGDRSKVVWLLILTLLAGGALGGLVHSRRLEAEPLRRPAGPTEPPAEDATPPLERGSLDRWAGWLGWAGVAALSGITALLTFEGLKVGFL